MLLFTHYPERNLGTLCRPINIAKPQESPAIYRATPYRFNWREHFFSSNYNHNFNLTEAITGQREKGNGQA